MALIHLYLPLEAGGGSSGTEGSTVPISVKTHINEGFSNAYHSTACWDVEQHGFLIAAGSRLEAAVKEQEGRPGPPERMLPAPHPTFHHPTTVGLPEHQLTHMFTFLPGEITQ